jgi:hypothetical protein
MSVLHVLPPVLAQVTGLVKRMVLAFVMQIMLATVVKAVIRTTTVTAAIIVLFTAGMISPALITESAPVMGLAVFVTLALTPILTVADVLWVIPSTLTAYNVWV